MKRSLLDDTFATSCYFRTSGAGDGRKALVQMRCAAGTRRSCAVT